MSPIKKYLTSVVVFLLSLGIIAVVFFAVPYLRFARETSIIFPTGLAEEQKKEYIKRRNAALTMEDPGPGGAFIFFEVGLIRNALKDYRGALLAFEKANEKSPKDHRILRAIATTLLYLEKPRRAATFFNQVKNLRPDNPELWLELPEIYSRDLKSPERAEVIYKEFLKKSPENLQVLQAYANFLSKEERYRESLRTWEKISKIDSAHGSNYLKTIEELRKKK